MTTLDVQFADATEDRVVSYVGCPQEAAAFPNQGELDASDPRWKTYYDAQDKFCIQPGLPAPTTE
jgi:hypothetical protein